MEKKSKTGHRFVFIFLIQFSPAFFSFLTQLLSFLLVFLGVSDKLRVILFFLFLDVKVKYLST